MPNIRPRSPYARVTVRTKPNVGKDPFGGRELGDQEFQIEDWWENVTGKSWMVSDGNIAAMAYAIRTGRNGNVPTDNEVLYGKIDGLGYIFHVSELCLTEV